jgi:hypothetical protein
MFARLELENTQRLCKEAELTAGRLLVESRYEDALNALLCFYTLHLRLVCLPHTWQL